MKMFMGLVLCSLSCLAAVFGDVSHLEHLSTTPNPGPAHPYVFSYQAGRQPGHVDRQHTEVSDGSGVIRGAFSYVDPKNQVRTVEYVADEHGFHPQLSHEVKDTKAVQQAKQNHLNLYNRIAQEHANQLHNPHTVVTSHAGGPQNIAVARATQKHLSEFERIAAEHARIGAEQEAARKAFEATSENSLAENSQYHH